jgi:hypothetical protein
VCVGCVCVCVCVCVWLAKLEQTHPGLVESTGVLSSPPKIQGIVRVLTTIAMSVHRLVVLAVSKG